MKKIYLFFVVFLFSLPVSFAQIKILFDNTKAETANNADWVIDADNWNLDISPNPTLGGHEANAQQIPTPSQAGITSTTTEDYWTGALSAWGVDAVKQGYSVETLPYNGSISYGNSNNPQDLSNYSIFVVCEPNILFTAAEKIALLTFVQNGGGLFMIADHDNSDRNGDGYDSPAVWNDFLTNNEIQNNPFGIIFDYEYFTDITDNIPSLPGDPLLHGSYGDVTSVEFYGGTSMSIDPAKNASVKAVAYRSGYSNTGYNGVLCAYATYGNGKVVALGDSSPADDGSGDPNDNLYDGWIEDGNGTHERLIMNATIWLAQQQIEILPQPSNNVTNFTVSATTQSTISLSWTDASGGQLPTSYLIKAAPNSAAISNPIDGTAETNSTLTKNVAYGVESVSFSSLASSTNYTFKIFPYTNSGADIDYLISATPETVGTTNEEASSIFCDDFEATLNEWNITNDPVSGTGPILSADFGGANTTNQAILFDAPNGDTDYYTSSIEKTFGNIQNLSLSFSYYFEDYRGGEIAIYINNVKQYTLYTDRTGDLLINSTDTDQWKQLTLDLSEATSTTGNYTLKIEGVSKTSTSWKDRVAIDEVCIFGTQTTATETLDQLNLSLYPNPSNGTFNLQLDDTSETYRVHIIDVSGKTIYKDNLHKGENLIQLNENVKGIFILLVETKNTSRQMKLIIQ